MSKKLLFLTVFCGVLQIQSSFASEYGVEESQTTKSGGIQREKMDEMISVFYKSKDSEELKDFTSRNEAYSKIELLRQDKDIKAVPNLAKQLRDIDLSLIKPIEDKSDEFKGGMLKLLQKKYVLI